MRPFHGFDTETALFAPGMMAPPMVCLSDASQADYATQTAHVTHARLGREGFERTRLLLLSAAVGSIRLVSSFIAYDMAVIGAHWPELLPLIFDAYDADGITDTKIRERLIESATGRMHSKAKGWYTLEQLAARYRYSHALDKDTWRLRYWEFAGIPVELWPEGAREYCRHDAYAPVHVALEQERYDDALDDQYRQARADFALHLMAVWGIHTDPVMVARLSRLTEAELARHEATLVREGLLWFDSAGKPHKRTKGMQEHVARLWTAAGFTRENLIGYEEVPADYLTDGGDFTVNKDTAAYFDDPVLNAYAGFTSADGVRSDVADLMKGTVTPIHARFEVLLATGRTSCSSPNLQNRAKEAGDRECFVARPGTAFLDLDYDGLELRSIAQAMIYAGISSRALANALNEDEDPHLMLAATMLSISYEDAKRRWAQYKIDGLDHAIFDARQAGKVGNFGLPAGLGVNSLITQARTLYKLTLKPDQVKSLKAAWFRTFPEMMDYQKFIRGIVGQHTGTVVHFKSDRIRAGVPFTVASNSFFQGLGADAAKAALYAVVRECYTGRTALAGCRPVNFIHDQVISEAPLTRLTEAAEVKRKIMCDVATEWFPDVPATTTPTASARWSKDAKTLRNKDTGELLVWESPLAKEAHEQARIR